MTARSPQPVSDSTATAARMKSNMRRCFICLTDEDPADAAGTWVDPCPCTLEAHQDCMLSWVTDCERSNRPLKCPVCKSLIELEGRWDPIVAIFDTVKRRFTRLSPYVLFTGISTGIQFSFQMYGALAMWIFSGKDALLRYVITTPGVANAANGTLSFAKDRVMPSLVMFSVGPALLLANVFPGFSNRIFLPTASIYGVLNMMHDEKFLSWPPSPQLTLAVYPYIRSIYYNLWRELVLPYELKLNKQLTGQPTQMTAPAENEAVVDAAVPENIVDPAAVRRREMDRNEPGVIEMLQTLVEALGGDDDDGPVIGQDGNERAEGNQRMVFELGIGDDGNEDAQLALAIEVEEIVEENVAPPALVDAVPAADEQARAADAIPAVGAGGNGADVPDEGPAANAVPNHEAPAPPVQRLGLGGVLSYLSDAVVGALILPGISFVAGECLRVLLPKKWTIPATRDPLTYRYVGGRPGLLQLQWGRSLIGGSLYIVLRDILRVYTKSRKVAALSTRRVRNVDRPRRTSK